ncbi:MAG: dihydrofolate reductase [Bacteroidia bacterium]
MNKIKLVVFVAVMCLVAFGFSRQNEVLFPAVDDPASGRDTFQYVADTFADVRVLRYKVPGFEELSLQQKKLAYYLYEAALSGRDMIWDQNYKYNLLVRKTIESIHNGYTGEHSGEQWDAFDIYSKQVFFSNGIHHHSSGMKIIPAFNEAYLGTLILNTDAAELSWYGEGAPQQLIRFLKPVIFDARMAAKKVNQAANEDVVKTSATNFYEGVSQQEVEDYYKAVTDTLDPTPISYGLNSKVMKEGGNVVERVWKKGGMYDAAITKVVYWLEKAASVAETPEQQKTINLLIDYYNTGDLKIFDEYNISWVKDTAASLDFINGFIEVYGDPLASKGSFESIVFFKDMEATKRIDAISRQAQWFEDNSPLMEEHKKKNVKGISAKVITVIVESGDASPSTPIGINLPNSNWIRAEHGSKSVNLGNIVHSYNKSSEGSGMLEAFAFKPEEIQRAKEFGTLADNLHTDMHEVIGHASGRLNPGIGTPKETLKQYASTLEEARADLVALYYVHDQKLVDMGLMPSLEVGKEAYDSYIRNGLLLQLRRIKPGESIEGAHMRNRQLVASWAFERGKEENVIERVMRDGKTYFVIRDYDKLKTYFGELLREIQRIKSEGDFEAGSALVENYGVKVDKEIHAEVLRRMAELNVAPYSGFINPVLKPVMQDDEIADVKVEYPVDFKKQMLYYGKNYGFLPVVN